MGCLGMDIVKILPFRVNSSAINMCGKTLEQPPVSHSHYVRKIIIHLYLSEQIEEFLFLLMSNPYTAIP
jgi:hypothetical protein